MTQDDIDAVEAGDICQCCGKWQPEDEAGHGLGDPVSCQQCIDEEMPIVDRTPE